VPLLQVIQGGLVGGPSGPGDSGYHDDRADYVTNEVRLRLPIWSQVMSASWCPTQQAVHPDHATEPVREAFDHLPLASLIHA
jgi:hypothetical protein